MNKRVGKVLGLVVLALLLLPVLALVLVELFERQLVAGPAISLFEERTGRNVRLEGLDLRWEWPLRLQADKLLLANATWGGSEPMLEVAEASATLNPVEILNGPPYTRLYLREPLVLLERSAQGDWNWSFDTTQPPSSQAPSLPVTIASEGGTLVYRDQGSGASLQAQLQRLSLLEAESVPGAERGEGQSEGEGREQQLPQAAVFVLEATREGLPLRVEAHIAWGERRWEGEASLRAGDSSLSGIFAARSGDSSLQLNASLESPLLAPAQLSTFMPTGGEQREMPLPSLTGVDAQVSLALAELRLPAFSLQALEGQVDLQDGALRLPSLAARFGDLPLEASAFLDTTVPDPALRVEVNSARAPLSALPEALQASSLPGQGEASLVAVLHMPGRQLPLSLPALLERLEIPQSRIVYARQEAEVVVSLEVQPAGGEPALSLNLQGPGMPELDASLAAPPLRQLPGEEPYPVELAVSSENARARVSGRLGDLLDEGDLQLEVSAEGSALPHFPAFGFEPPPLPPFEVSGDLRREGPRWSLQDLALSLGDSSIRGSAAYSAEGETPYVSLDLHSDFLDLPRLREAFASSAAGTPADGSAQASADVAPQDNGGASDLLQAPLNQGPQESPLLEALRAAEADVALAVERLRVTEEHEVEKARLGAHLEQGRLAVETLAFDALGGHVEGTLDMDGSRRPIDGQVALDVENLRLGELNGGLARLEEHLGRMSGELHLAVRENPAPEEAGEVLLPALGRLSMDGTRLSFRDPQAGTDLQVTLDTQGLETAEREQTLVLQGEGRYRGKELMLEFQGGPLLALRDPSRPYPLQGELSLGQAQASVDGQVDLLGSGAPSASFDFNLRAGEGSVVADLLPVPGLEIPPDLAPVKIQGHLAFEEGAFSFGDLSAQMGGSDLRGDLSVDLSGASPSLMGSLRSERLDLDALRSLWQEDEKGGTGPEEEEPSEGVIPDDPINVSALRRLNADLDFQAGELQVGGTTLENVEAELQAQEGKISFSPFRANLAGGSLDLRLELETADEVLEGVVEVEARRVKLSEVLEDAGQGDNSFGLVGGQGKFWLRGDSPASLLGSADGGLMLMMSGGGVDALLVELAGLDLGEALLVSAGLADSVPIDCGYARVYARQGILEIDRFVLDTRDTLFFLEGSVDLGEEALDLTLYPEAKDVGFPASDSPLNITGTFREPEIGLDAEGVAARGLGAFALTALAGPFAALLPFVELGEGEEPLVCEGWVKAIEEAS